MAEQTGATPERLALAARVADLRTQGLTYREVAVKLDISRSYASMLATDPAGAGQRRRRDSYDGVCLGCGGATKSDGTSRPSDRCAACHAALQSAERKWTREAVIDAIQRFAASHGRPPTTTEWKTADAANGYPPCTAVYGSASSNPSSPFVKWADAIEAAGFARPRAGYYPRPQRRDAAMPRNYKRPFVVLEEIEDGVWREHRTIAANEQLAVEQHLVSLVEKNGAADHRYVAVSEARWNIRQLQQVTTFRAVLAEPATA